MIIIGMILLVFIFIPTSTFIPSTPTPTGNAELVIAIMKFVCILAIPYLIAKGIKNKRIMALASVIGSKKFIGKKISDIEKDIGSHDNVNISNDNQRVYIWGDYLELLCDKDNKCIEVLKNEFANAKPIKNTAKSKKKTNDDTPVAKNGKKTGVLGILFIGLLAFGVIFIAWATISEYFETHNKDKPILYLYDIYEINYTEMFPHRMLYHAGRSSSGFFQQLRLDNTNGMHFSTYNDGNYTLNVSAKKLRYVIEGDKVYITEDIVGTYVPMKKDIPKIEDEYHYDVQLEGIFSENGKYLTIGETQYVNSTYNLYIKNKIFEVLIDPNDENKEYTTDGWEVDGYLEESERKKIDVSKYQIIDKRSNVDEDDEGTSQGNNIIDNNQSNSSDNNSNSNNNNTSREEKNQYVGTYKNNEGKTLSITMTQDKQLKIGTLTIDTTSWKKYENADNSFGILIEGEWSFDGINGSVERYYLVPKSESFFLYDNIGSDFIPTDMSKIRLIKDPLQTYVYDSCVYYKVD